jgi:hypothetical protein
MCLFHVIKQFKDGKDGLPKAKVHEKAVEEILEDVQILSRATCQAEFEKGWSL